MPASRAPASPSLSTSTAIPPSTSTNHSSSCRRRKAASRAGSWPTASLPRRRSTSRHCGRVKAATIDVAYHTRVDGWSRLRRQGDPDRRRQSREHLRDRLARRAEVDRHARHHLAGGGVSLADASRTNGCCSQQRSFSIWRSRRPTSTQRSGSATPGSRMRWRPQRMRQRSQRSTRTPGGRHEIQFARGFREPRSPRFSAWSSRAWRSPRDRSPTRGRSAAR